MAQVKATASREAAKRKPRAKATTGAKRKPVKSKAPVKRATARKSASNGIGPRKKPTISAVHFIGELARKLAEMQSVQALYDGRLDEGFREELMVAVAFQNQAPYCNWGHRTWASLAGVSDEELAKIEELSLENLDPKVSTAVTYVRALVSSDWEDAPRELRQQMQEYFTWREIEDIELIARAMDLSNPGSCINKSV